MISNMHRYQCMNQVHRPSMQMSPPLQPFQPVHSYNAWKVIYPLNSLKVMSWSKAWPKNIRWISSDTWQSPKTWTSPLLHCSLERPAQSNPTKGNVGCFQKFWYPQIIHSNRVFHYNTIYFGVPLFSETSIYYQNDRASVTNPRVLYYSGDGALCFFLRSLLHFQKFAIPWRANLLWQLLWSSIHSGWARKLGWTLPLNTFDRWGNQAVQNNHRGQLMAIGPVLCVISFTEQQATNNICHFQLGSCGYRRGKKQLQNAVLWNVIATRRSWLQCLHPGASFYWSVLNFHCWMLQKVLGTKDHFLVTASLHSWQ